MRPTTVAPDQLRAIQVGLNTTDTAGTLRLYSEAFGYQNGGGTALWGYTIGIQGLSGDSRALISWLVSGREFFQLEVFQHSRPAPRLLPDDWRPTDHGWTRFGVAVEDFDQALRVLGDWDVEFIGGVRTADGRPRAAFRDPFCGVVVEVLATGADAGAPYVEYVTFSTGDLESAARVYRDALGFELLPIDTLHSDTNERSLGASEDREGFVVCAGGTSLEVVRYSGGRPKSVGARICDQGIMNVALGARVRAPVGKAIDALRGLGYEPPNVVDRGGERVGAYFVDPDVELEIISMPAEFDAAFGFVPGRPFLT
jgi:catechol 2,3-dioxygenase-like lactoylglutathione lyase family enzyme